MWNLPHPTGECALASVVVAAASRGEAAKRLRADGWHGVKADRAWLLERSDERSAEALKRPGSVLWRHNPPLDGEAWRER